MKLSLRPLLRPFNLPLLAKDLYEMAAQRRTYIVRFIYAAILYFIACSMIYNYCYHNADSVIDPFQVLGIGSELFMMLIYVQFMGIALFLPALMSSAITAEKENQSIMLLMITDLRPWQIVMQKYIARMIPMFTFLLLSMPLLAVTYAMGGITPERVITACMALVATVLQLGALTLMISAWCRSSVAAFISSYFLGALFYLGPPIGCMVLIEIGILPYSLFRSGFIEKNAMCHIPPALFFRHIDSPMTMVQELIPTGVTIVFFLLMARVFLVRRAFLEPKNFLVSIFKLFDRGLGRINSVTGNVTFLKSKGRLTEKRPIAWLEVNRRALGKPHYLVRLLLLICFPPIVLLIILLSSISRQGANFMADLDMWLIAFIGIYWVLAMLFIMVQGASTFAYERTRQTLDPLLILPITGREIVKQKAAALNRLVWVWCVPLLILVLVRGFISFDFGFEFNNRYSMGYDSFDSGIPPYLLGALLGILIYPRLFAWLSLLIGMRSRNTRNATIGSLVVFIGWCAIPPLLVEMVRGAYYSDSVVYSSIGWVQLFGPATFPSLNEIGEIRYFKMDYNIAMSINFVFYAASILMLRFLCFKNADRWLGRV